MHTVIPRADSATVVFRHAIKHEDVHVPECATCPGFCCHDDAIVLHPDEGDDPSLYQTVKMPHPFKDEVVDVLDHKPNGDCIYLDVVDGVGRCGVYDHRPIICRGFDCSRSFAKIPRDQRRRMIRRGLLSKGVMAKGREVRLARIARGDPL
jgi:Fe-S-cluster containining protein